MTRLIAIDPGAHGAVAWMDTGDRLEEPPSVTPFHGLGETDILAILIEVAGSVSLRPMAVIERVHAIPGIGSTSSSFAFGRSYGFLRGVLATLVVPYRDVPPGKWQAGLGLDKKLQGPARKRALRDIACQRYPHLRPTLDTCDALLILDWFNRETRGGT